MRVLFQNVELCFPGSELHGKVLDVLLEYGKVKAIDSNIELAPRTKIVSGGILAPGFVDIGCFGGEPGFEHRETRASLVKAASKGGYTHVYILPNLDPVTDNKSAVRFLKNHGEVVQIHALGAISQGLKGIDLADIFDMHENGVSAFTDGMLSIQNTGLMKRALEYVKAFDGIVINQPYDYSIEPEGVVHESIVSTKMGLKGIPSLSEISMLKRDLDLLEYTGSRLIAHNISAAFSTTLISEAKKKDLRVFASVALMNLIENETSVETFDTHYLLNPPLRSESDRKTLVKALKNGVIDAIVSGHMPLENDLKTVEFGHAEPGVATLPFVFPVLYDKLQKFLSLEDIVRLLSTGPRKMLGLDSVEMQVGSEVDYVWLDLEKETSYSPKDFPSKSINSPFLNQNWKGSVNGVFRGDQYLLF